MAGLALLLALALSARVAVYIAGSDRPTNDELAYRELATSIATGQGFERGGRPETHIAPLFPLLHALPVALGAEAHQAGRTLALLISALAAPLVAWALAPALGWRWGLAGGLLVALHPRLLVTAERLQPEALSAALLLLFCGWWLRDRPWGVGLAAALAYLARPEAFMLLPLTAVGVGVEAVRRRASWRRWLAPLAVALALTAPYLLHLRSATGDWGVTGKARWVYALGVVEARAGNEPVATADLRQVEAEVGSPWEHARRRPLELARGYVLRLGLAARYLAAALGWPLAALAVVGVIGLARSAARATGLWLPLALLLVIPLGAVHARHVLPYAPLLLGAAIWPLAWLRRRLAPAARRMTS